MVEVLWKQCPECAHRMELVEAEPTQPLQPRQRFQCLCGAWLPLYTAKDEGEA